MWAEINGERKKVACGPCIRGHRSSKCDHRDRVLVEVRKPGRPLSSCPHPSGSCSCERVVINYTIPKTSECACPSERTQSVVSPAAGSTARVQKSRSRKATNNFTTASLEKAIKASQDAETDSSSLQTRTPTNPSFAPSDKSGSNEASPPSSASSTPRILASPSRKQSYSSDVRLPDAPLASSAATVSSCCKPAPAAVRAEPVQQRIGGSCCSSKVKEPVQPAIEKKACCSGPSQQKPVDVLTQMGAPNLSPNFPQYTPYPQQQGQYHGQAFGGMHPAFGFNVPANMSMPVPHGFNTPIYNHMANGYQHAAPMTPTQPSNHAAEHNCHCGDSCSCFGCAAHPHNATMTEYIRTMHQYMSTGGFGSLPPPTYDLPSYPHHPGFGAEAVQNMMFNTNSHSTNFPPLVGPQMQFQPSVNGMMNVPHTPINESNPWQPIPVHASISTPSTADAQYFNTLPPSRDGPIDLKKEEVAASPIFTDSPSEGKDEETPTLSPSSYFWQELVLPGCNDATGTCQCGDGCECVGCLTHGGHNGVSLTDPVTSGAESFNDFLTSDNLNSSDTINPNHFISGAFTEAPS